MKSHRPRDDNDSPLHPQVGVRRTVIVVDQGRHSWRKIKLTSERSSERHGTAVELLVRTRKRAIRLRTRRSVWNDVLWTDISPPYRLSGKDRNGDRRKSKHILQATLTFVPSTGVLSYDVRISGLNGTASHLHGAAEGQNGPILVGFQGGPTRWTGTAVLTQEQATALLSGQTYVNVHSEVNPGGELRAQVQ